MKYKELLLQYKKQVIGGVVLILVIIIGINSLLKGSKDGEEIISPNSNTKQAVIVDDNLEIKEYDYKEAINHIGERAIVKGMVVKVFTAKSGVTFLDFCEEFSNCPFSAVIFASDLKKFDDVQKLLREVKITGLIKSYNGKAEIILNSPTQIN